MGENDRSIAAPLLICQVCLEPGGNVAYKRESIVGKIGALMLVCIGITLFALGHARFSRRDA